MKFLRVIVLLGLSVGIFGVISAQSLLDEIYHQRSAKSKIPVDLIEGSQWRHRLIVVCKNDKRSDLNIMSNLRFRELLEAYLDRDLIVVSTSSNSGTAMMPYKHGEVIVLGVRTQGESIQAVTRLAQCTPGENSLSLIGKDGTLKQKWTTPVSAETVFTLIDAMPMRQQEMRQQDMRQREIREKSE